MPMAALPTNLRQRKSALPSASRQASSTMVTSFCWNWRICCMSSYMACSNRSRNLSPVMCGCGAKRHISSVWAATRVLAGSALSTMALGHAGWCTMHWGVGDDSCEAERSSPAGSCGRAPPACAAPPPCAPAGTATWAAVAELLQAVLAPLVARAASSIPLELFSSAPWAAGASLATRVGESPEGTELLSERVAPMSAVSSFKNFFSKLCR
mmetsp:Transcript_16096/g.46012  ORF Transcript_16096/g.46012 Transcript_16096/m.46012 type:complete len:211 (-) Transcript_16096:270-902(-)